MGGLIPDDVQRSAGIVADACDDNFYYDVIKCAAERAILAERQRCADIVLNTTTGRGRSIPSKIEDNPLAQAILAQ